MNITVVFQGPQYRSKHWHFYSYRFNARLNQAPVSDWWKRHMNRHCSFLFVTLSRDYKKE